ncbi:MAG TPA: histone deacetylase, partial [Vicinamibacteria bacterium]|nr:histone deacetylase [Vicinamibacteria bacterium]
GLVNVPAYFHNARFYAPPFAFLHPAGQGRFEALRRDLAGVAVAEASAALEAGRVIDAATGEPVTWAPGDMLAALSPPVREYLASPEYAGAVAAAREAHRFRLVEGA